MKFCLFDHIDKRNEPLERTFDERLAVIKAAEGYGFHSYHLAEHHGTPHGMAPSPHLFLAAAARETKTIRLGALSLLLPLYHPIRLYEEICMLDHLSGGRLEIGIGRGISPIETAFFGVAGSESREVFREVLDVLLTAFEVDVLSHQGPYFQIDAMPIVIHPLQRPHPPLWAGVGDESSQRFAMNHGINAVALGSVERVRKMVAFCRQAWSERADEGSRRLRDERPLLGAARHILVADSDREARALARVAYEAWYGKLSTLWAERGLSVNSPVIYPTYAEAERQGTVIAGSPATVRERLSSLIDLCGIDMLLGEFTWGTLTHRQEMHSVSLFGEEVMPVLAAREPRTPALSMS